MRVVLDENLPANLAPLVPSAAASTVRAEGWSGVTNGELLQRIAGRFNALLTMGQYLQHQQNLTSLPFGVVFIRARSNPRPDVDLKDGAAAQLSEAPAAGAQSVMPQGPDRNDAPTAR